MTIADDPLYRRIRLHADRRLVEPHQEGDDPGVVLARFKEFLRLEDVMQQRYHRAGDSGFRVTLARSVLIDVLLEVLFEQAVAKLEDACGGKEAPVALVALGGYGRAELCPKSDIDIMILLPSRGKAKMLDACKEALTNHIFYMLWDLGLKVGHSTRQVNEAIAEAEKDTQTLNSLLECRFLVGSREVYDGFTQRFEKYRKRLDYQRYYQERIDSRAHRHDRSGNTPYLQEPDIKEATGGLRDYQSVLWLGRTRFGPISFADLCQRLGFPVATATEVHEAYGYLLRVRTELHNTEGRATDLLNLTNQPNIALGMGFEQEDIFERVEAFMRQYYQAARSIYLNTQRMIEALHPPERDTVTFANVIASRRMATEWDYIDGLVIRDDGIGHDRGNPFEDDPLRLIRVFRHAQSLSRPLDPELQNLILESRFSLTPDLLEIPAASRAFLSILQTPGEVGATLEQMHELGILNRVVPEFQRLDCLVQHEYYHSYTADQHTLRTIYELDRVFSGDARNSEVYRKALHRVRKPSLLYLILLLHDIGKGFGVKGHAARGREMAVPILERLGVAPGDIETILFIIEHHLEMARFWQRFDLEDDRAIQRFAEFVQSPAKLHFLFVHTFCDAQGTARGLWNDFKQSLHNQLYMQTLKRLSGDASTQPSPAERPAPISVEEAQGVSQEEIDAHYMLLPQRYFLHTSRTEIALHLNMIHQLLEQIASAETMGALRPIIDWRDDLDLSLTVVNVVTWDRPGLFYKLAGAFAVAGTSIRTSRAISRSDHILIDTFYVSAPDGGVVRDAKAKERFRETLEAVLVSDRDLLSEIEANAKAKAQPSYLRQRTTLKAPIQPEIDLHHEMSLGRTILEIQASDCVGLLYRIARIIFRHQFDISFARITTERGAAHDTFYLEPSSPQTGQSTTQLVALRQQLSEELAIIDAEADL